jgi:hypothetical protein
MTPTIIRIDGKPRRAMRHSCWQCKASHEVLTNSIQGHSNNDEQDLALTVRKFEAQGWNFIKPKKALCPDCAKAANTAPPKPKQQEFATMKKQDIKPEEMVAAPAPRTMQRSDRQIIIAKLLDVYVGEKAGYAPGWTDEKVSTDLGVPRAWVEQLRVENFGDLATNPEIEAAVEEGKAVLGRIRQEFNDLKLKTSLAMAEATRPFQDRQLALADDIARVERKLADIAKAVRI